MQHALHGFSAAPAYAHSAPQLANCIKGASQSIFAHDTPLQIETIKAKYLGIKLVPA